MVFPEYVYYYHTPLAIYSFVSPHYLFVSLIYGRVAPMIIYHGPEMQLLHL